jgi:phytoene synthase
MSESDEFCASLVGQRDRDRFLATLYAPSAIRAAMHAVNAFDLELVQVVRTTTEPMLGQIRLAWWRERLQSIASDAPVPGQPVIRSLAAHVIPRRLQPLDLEPLEDAALALLENDIAQHVALRGDTLFDALLRLVAIRPDEELRAKACQAGRLWAATQLVMSGRDEVRGLAESLAAETPERSPEGPSRPVFALAALARADLKRRRKPGQPDGVPASPRRQLRILWSIVRGHS